MTKGEELLVSLNGVRDFLSDLGQLLVAGDTLMAAASWESYAGNACHQGASSSVLEGRRWLPRAVFRRYYNGDEYPTVLALVSVLLEDEDFDLTEPLVCGTYFVFPEDTPEDRIDVDAWNALWPGWRVETYDGAPVEMDDSDEDWKEKWGWRYMQTFARRLVEVTNQDDLKAKVVDPLFELIEAKVSTPADARSHKSGK